MYEEPRIEITIFEVKDVITTSDMIEEGGQGGGVVLPDDPDGF